MSVLISLLRGVNLGPTRRMKMDALRAMYESLKFECVETLIQSGNVVCRGEAKGAAKRIEAAIERTFGFQSDVIVRTVGEMREIVAKNPFRKREGLDPGKLLVWFMAGDPGAEARKKVKAIDTAGEEVYVADRELYIYFQNGQGQTKMPLMAVDKALGVRGTGRNWNTTVKLLEMGERLEARVRTA